ncbi:MAG: riboflavin synthase [Thermoanaerobaculia bacterium]
MFSGIIESIGRVSARTEREVGVRLEIRAPGRFGRFRKGESVAVSGVCLTAISGGPVFRADLSSETLSRTSLGALRSGDPVNLERSVRLSDRLSGHLVAGHVDGLARVRSIREDGGGRVFTFSIPARLSRYVVEKGSVALDGISLTAIAVRRGEFSVAVIPFTWRSTTLSRRSAGDVLNFEADMMAKFAEALLKHR